MTDQKGKTINPYKLTARGELEKRLYYFYWNKNRTKPKPNEGKR